jgi:pimeloyl-ACP methyl ester carboxylesterase
VPYLTLPPTRAGSPATQVHYRERGHGPLVLLLHGGWGYEAYPFDRQMEALAVRHLAIAPDRVGYGRSDRRDDLEDGFHRRMAAETIRVLDALGVERASLWGHSDGAVVAAWTAILRPDRVRALVLEALHFRAAKERSIGFFRDAVEAPERFGDAVVAALRRDHADRWRDVVAAGGRAWLRIIERARGTDADLYGGRFGEIAAPTLLLHGTRDPRTEPGEVDAARRALPAARVAWVEAGHAPHASAGAGARATEVAVAFLDDAAEAERRAATGTRS